jgi:tetratricopeptide (TPR) repeat protein
MAIAKCRDKDKKDEYQSRLELYRKSKPFRDDSPERRAGSQKFCDEIRSYLFDKGGKAKVEIPVEDFGRALTLCDKSVQLTPRWVGPYFLRMVLRTLAKKDLELAIADCDEIIRLGPTKDTLLFAYRTRAEIRESQKSFAQALGDYNAALEISPHNSEIQGKRLALAFRHSKELGKALSQPEVMDPVSISGLRETARKKFLDHDYDAALKAYDELMRLDGTHAMDFLDRGAIWHVKGDSEAAIKDFTDAIRFDPKDATAYLCRGIMLRQKGDLDGAIKDFNQAIQLDPQRAVSFVQRGDAWKDRRDLDGAIKDYNEAIRLDPNNSSAYNGRAWIWATAKDAKYRYGKGAVEDATKACELANWKNGWMLGTLAAACAETGDFEKAIEWQQKAIALYPTNKDREDARQRLALYRESKPHRQQ